jgi:hypothetical protein
MLDIYDTHFPIGFPGINIPATLLTLASTYIVPEMASSQFRENILPVL